MKNFVGIIPPCVCKDYTVVHFNGRGQWAASTYHPTAELARHQAQRLRRLFNKKKDPRR